MNRTLSRDLMSAFLSWLKVNNHDEGIVQNRSHVPKESFPWASLRWNDSQRQAQQDETQLSQTQFCLLALPLLTTSTQIHQLRRYMRNRPISCRSTRF